MIHFLSKISRNINFSLGISELHPVFTSSFMVFNKATCKVLHLGCGNPIYILRKEFFESSPDKKDLGVVDEKLNFSQ